MRAALLALPLLPLLTTSCSLFLDASRAEGEGEHAEGEGDVVGEGEGEVVGKGEGEVEGEGEGEVVGEGEGEVDWLDFSKPLRRHFEVNVDATLLEAIAPVQVLVPGGGAVSFFDDADNVVAAEFDHALFDSEVGGLVSAWWVRARPADGLVAYFDATSDVAAPEHVPEVWGADLRVLLHFTSPAGSNDDAGRAVFASEFVGTYDEGGIVRLDGNSCVAFNDDISGLVTGAVDTAIVVAGVAAGPGRTLMSWAVAAPGDLTISRLSMFVDATSGMYSALVRIPDNVVEPLRFGGTDAVVAVFVDASGGSGNVVYFGNSEPVFATAGALSGFDELPPQAAHFGCDDGDVSGEFNYVGILDEVRVRVGTPDLDALSIALEQRGLSASVFFNAGDDVRP